MKKFLLMNFYKNYLLIFFLISSKAFAGGWGSTGGGGGVACFSKTEYAEQAETKLKMGLPLSLDLKNQITEVVALDYWEWRETKSYELFTPQGKEYQNILSEVNARFSFISPLFMYRLQQSAQLIDKKVWIEKPFLTRLNDANTTITLPKQCVRIQIFTRYHKEDNKSALGKGPQTTIPEVMLEFDEWLFNKMDSINQAVLVLHEQIYLIGHTIGHTTSDDIRFIVMRFFEKDLSKPSPIQNKNFYFRYVLSAYFGDYVLYFDDLPKADYKPLSQESRFRSYIKLIKTIKNKIKECLKSEPDVIKCKDLATDPNENKKWFTKELSFIYVSTFLLDNTYKYFNSEFLVTPLETESFLLFANQHLFSACRAIKDHQDQLGYYDITKQALAYCSQSISYYPWE